MAALRERENLITSYGLLWSVDGTGWSRRQMLGRPASRRARQKILNFWSQPGIYVLVGSQGAHYVGIATELGPRIRAHLKDRHEKLWDSYSWFGAIGGPADLPADRAAHSDRMPKSPKKPGRDPRVIKPWRAWSDIEAMLFHSLDTVDRTKTPYFGGPVLRYEQVRSTAVKQPQAERRRPEGRSLVKRKA